MLNVLILAPNDKGGLASTLAGALRKAGYAVGRTPLHHGPQALDNLCRAFAGRPPDVLPADLSDAADCLP